MGIHNLLIKNFKCIRRLELDDFKHINILVGRNCCGKTSVLEAIYILACPMHAYMYELEDSAELGCTYNYSQYMVNKQLVNSGDIYSYNFACIVFDVNRPYYTNKIYRDQNGGDILGRIYEVIKEIDNNIKSLDYDPSSEQIIYNYKEHSMKHCSCSVDYIANMMLNMSVYRDTVILFENIGSAFDKHSLELMWQEILKSIADNGDMQIFATTHSLENLNILCEQLYSADINEDILRVYRLDNDNGIVRPVKYDHELLADMLEDGFEIR